MRGVDTNLVTALHALLSQQNVTRAAKDVGLSQSSMSHALARLRAHFDDPLLVPAGRKLVLTDRAKSLIEPTALAVARLEAVFARSESFNPKTSRMVFRIAATDNLELYVLPELAASLQKTAPQVTIRVCALPRDWMTALRRGEIDLKLGRKSQVADGVESQDLSKEQYACVVRRGHPAPARPTLQQWAALDHLLITPTAGPEVEPSGAVDALLAKHALRRRTAMTVPHFLVAPYIVARSDLVLTAPARLLAQFIEPLELRRLTLPIRLGSYTLSQVWATRTRDNEAQRFLRAAVARTLRAS